MPFTSVSQWEASKRIAERLLPIIGDLNLRNIRVFIYGVCVQQASAVDVLSACGGSEWGDACALVERASKLLEMLRACDVECLSVDVGVLAERSLKEHPASLQRFLEGQLSGRKYSGRAPQRKDLVLYGFGRIGRLLARLCLERASSVYPVRLKAIVLRNSRDGDLSKRAHLLQYDSVHGPFSACVAIDEPNNALIVNGNPVKLLCSDGPDSLDYTRHDIHDALLVDNTGQYSDEPSLKKHLEGGGVSQVVLTAPAKGCVKTIVMGVNHAELGNDQIVSAASCTTNAVVPVLKALYDEFRIEHGHIETVHAYTNDQQLVDNYHPKPRRGRSAPLNMVITQTGASQAVVAVLPELAGKLTGNAIRVPVANVSLAILSLQLSKSPSMNEFDSFLRSIPRSSLREQVAYSDSHEAVSSDFISSPFAGIIDGPNTQLTHDGRCVVYVWYDNEFGYSCQVLRLIEELCTLKYSHLPAI